MFYQKCSKILSENSWDSLCEQIENCSAETVNRVLSKPEIGIDDLWALLSPAAGLRLEEMAQRSHQLTLQRFGRTVLMYAPLYISNYCTNLCIYCGFNAKNKIDRYSLTIDEAVGESKLLRAMGFRHILLVSGEHPDYATLKYLSELSDKLRKDFSSICIEIQPLEKDEYKKLINHGVDCVTCYQETYNPEKYSTVHPGGKKSDYEWRLNTLDRAAQAGIRKAGLSALYGLDNWRVEGLFSGLHAHFLMTNYWQTQVSISFPRLTHAEGDFVPEESLPDKGMAQLICALRLVLPDVHIVLSTREKAKLRDKMLLLGVTQMSAASKTSPLGYSHGQQTGEQFDVMDTRSAKEVADAIFNAGYEPVWKDWDREFLTTNYTNKHEN